MNLIYKLLRVINDLNAIFKGRAKRRAKRRVVGRVFGKILRRIK